MNKRKLIELLQWCGAILLIVLLIAFFIAWDIFSPALKVWVIKTFVF